MQSHGKIETIVAISECTVRMLPCSRLLSSASLFYILFRGRGGCFITETSRYSYGPACAEFAFRLILASLRTFLFNSAISDAYSISQWPFEICVEFYV